MNIYKELEQFIEGEAFDILETVVDNNELTIGDLEDTSEITAMISDAIEEMLADNYDGEALEIVETIFNQNEEEFFNTHMPFFICTLRSYIKGREY